MELQDEVDYILINARIYTMEKKRKDRDFSNAMAISKRGRFLSIGTNEEIKKKYHTEKIIDAKGKTILPGFVDAHAHLYHQGCFLREVDLVGSSSIEEVVRRLKSSQLNRQHCQNHQEWIIGLGWDQNLFPNKEFPTKESLDVAFPDTPVWLTRIDFHAGWCNSALLNLIGPIYPGVDVPGGCIVRDNGNPTGILIDNAMSLVQCKIPKFSKEEQKERMKLAVTECNKYGITCIHDASLTDEMLQNIKELIDLGEFNLRLYGMLTQESFERAKCEPKIIDYGDKLTVQAAKLFMDGALGSRGAALLIPYSDDPKNSGLLLETEQDYFHQVRAWILHGFQVNTHAIGDRANRIVVQTYAKVIDELGLHSKDLRLRVEHAQIVVPEDIKIFKKYNIIASMQPTHATSDMSYAEQRLGPERVRYSYTWRSFLNAGVHVAFGSDFPVEKVNPLLGIYSAVTRQDLSGKPERGWIPEQRVLLHEALQGFTIDAAYAAFQENKLGSIEPGKLADYIILDADLYTIAKSDIPDVRVLHTYVGGKLVYSFPVSKL